MKLKDIHSTTAMVHINTISYCCYNKSPQTLWLKQYKFIILHCWKSGSKWVLWRQKSRCQQCCLLSGGYREESLPFTVCRSHLLASAHGTFLRLQSPSLQPLIVLSYFLFLVPILLFPSYKYTCDFVRPTEIIQDKLPISRSLT